MDENRKIIRTGLIVFVILVVGVALYYFFLYKKPAGPDSGVERPAAVEQKEPAAATGETAPSAVPPVGLDESDDLVRRLSREISSHPRLALWLRSENLIRRFVAAVDNIAGGQSPRAHLDFFVPKGNFKAVKRGQTFYPDPAGYARYDRVVEVFVSLEAKSCAGLFRSLKPLCQVAYRDLGYPTQGFEETLIRAVMELLRTPIVERGPALEKSVVNYVMTDPMLEGLSEAQKHLLRMGPENVGAVLMKLREMAEALGVPSYQLPQPQYYAPQRQ